MASKCIETIQQFDGYQIKSPIEFFGNPTKTSKTLEVINERNDPRSRLSASARLFSGRDKDGEKHLVIFEVEAWDLDYLNDYTGEWEDLEDQLKADLIQFLQEKTNISLDLLKKIEFPQYNNSYFVILT